MFRSRLSLLSALITGILGLTLLLSGCADPTEEPRQRMAACLEADDFSGARRAAEALAQIDSSLANEYPLLLMRIAKTAADSGDWERVSLLRGEAVTFRRRVLSDWRPLGRFGLDGEQVLGYQRYLVSEEARCAEAGQAIAAMAMSEEVLALCAAVAAESPEDTALIEAMTRVEADMRLQQALTGGEGIEMPDWRSVPPMVGLLGEEPPQGIVLPADTTPAPFVPMLMGEPPEPPDSLIVTLDDLPTREELVDTLKALGLAEARAETIASRAELARRRLGDECSLIVCTGLRGYQSSYLASLATNGATGQSLELGPWSRRLPPIRRTSQTGEPRTRWAIEDKSNPLRRVLGAAYAAGLMRNGRIRGSVLVGFSITTEGATSNVRIMDSNLGAPAVEEVIMAAVRQWDFGPGDRRQVSWAFSFLEP